MGAKRTMPTVVVLDGDNTQLANFLGPLDENLRQIAIAWGVEVGRNGNRINIEGAQAQAAANAIHLFHRQARHKDLSIDDIQLGLVELKASPVPSRSASPTSTSSSSTSSNLASSRSVNRSKELLAQEEVLPELPPLDDDSDSIALRTRRSDLRPRTPRQRAYLNNILRHDITFGVGPAGTGKTWLAVACAIDALERDNVQRIILTRPAVEAGERLGFLPGDLAQKVDPYLRPLYDALYDLMGFDKVQRLFEKQTIEIAPLAYMRGRTLNHAFVILDEAQNTTPEQMKMFLTRIGFGSKAVITGDPSQVDLPRGQRSGLSHSLGVLSGVQGIAVSQFTSKDVVRHPLVGRIIDAYEAAEAMTEESRHD
ncbi:MAG: PhoH family protein [Pelistega sp.]|nr:PhoH family protein [Pelistega sp.]